MAQPDNKLTAGRSSTSVANREERRVVRSATAKMHKVDLMADWILSGDRSHPNLKLVDNLRTQITYDGHSSDIASLERAHIEGDTHTFEHTLFKIKELENMYYADRSHPHLVQLDSLRPTLTYDGWKKDFKRAEQIHVGSRAYYLFYVHRGDETQTGKAHW